MEILEQSFGGNTVRAWAVAAGVGIVALVVLRVFQAVVLSRFVAHARKSEVVWDDVLAEALSRTKFLFLALVAVYAGSLGLELPERAHTILTRVTVIALLVQGGLWVGAAITSGLALYRKQRLTDDPAAATTVSAMSFVARLVLWAVVLLLALDNLGVNITALVAGLGIGGIAVALAVQNILGDLFASLSIVLDKPFVLGDFLIVGEHLGSVEHIGLKTTRLRSLSGEQLVFSNADLLGSRVRNFGRMYQRRVVFKIGVTYQTGREELEEIPKILREAIETQEKTRFDRAHFKEFGDFSLNFEAVYYVEGPDYALYMDIQQAINLRIRDEFEKRSIEFAYPTQTLHVGREAGVGIEETPAS